MKMGYNYNTFLKTLNISDKSIKIFDTDGIMKYTINPFSIINVMVSHNILKINLKNDKIIMLSFSSINESKLSLIIIQEQINILIHKVPLRIDNDINNYIKSSGTSGTSGTTSGSSGESGTSGSSGLTGANGSSGSSGLTGANGSSGSSGLTGANGSSGSSGLTGANGSSGSSGLTGANGSSGSSGSAGSSGSSGTSGTSPVFQRITVADTNYTISGTNNQIIVYTSISARRIVTLPITTTPGQIIQILDESGSVNETRRIRVERVGGDTIEGDIYNIQIFPYSSTTYTGDGVSRWTIGERPGRLSSGNIIVANYTNLGNGSISLADNGLYNLFTTPTGLGPIRSYEIDGGTFSLTDGVTNYIVSDYNSGSPIMRLTTDVTIINETTISPMYTIYRYGLELHVIDWDQLGLSLVNKLHQSIVKTQRYRLESGLIIGEVPTQTITVGSGVVWIGANRFLLETFNSASDTTHLAYHSGGTWSYSTITKYNNTQYDNGVNLVLLNPNKYAVNYVYRGVEVDSECFVVLGGGNYSLLEAQGSIPPSDLPLLITSHCILVGRILVLQAATASYQIDSIFSAAFALSKSAVHNDLTGIQGGSASEYYHLPLPVYTNVVASNGLVYRTATMTSGTTYSFTNNINTLSVNKTIGSTTSVILKVPPVIDNFYVVKDRKGDSLTNPIIVSAGTYSIDGDIYATMSQVGKPSLTFLFTGNEYIII